MNTRLYVIAIAPGIALALGIYLTDRHDKEPIHLLIKTFILGALSTIPVAIIEKGLMFINIFPGILGSAYTAFIVAGVTEEYFKRLVVLKLPYRDEAFNEKLDGIVYAVFSALGFATVENVMYVVFRFATNPYIGLYRGILSVPAHMLFGVTMGYYLSLSKFADNEATRRQYFTKSLTVPILLHGIFDFIIMSGVQLLMLLLVPFVLYLWITNLRKLNEYTKDARRLNDIFHRLDDRIEKDHKKR